MNKFNLIHIFLNVSNLSSFSAAAMQLGVDPSTVSKAIQQLEAHLNLRLFNRTTRKLHLTEAGRTYKDECANLLGSLETCEQQLHAKKSQPKGILKINVPVAYGQMYIMPMMSAFCARYPEIELDISFTDDYVDMISNAIDIAIRTGQLQDSCLVAKMLSPMDFGTFSAPSLLKKYPVITAKNIDTLPWIAYKFIHTGRLMPVYRVQKKGEKKILHELSPKPVLTVTDGLSLVTACKAGMGLIQAPHFLVRDAIINEELEQVQDYYRSEQFNVYAYYSHKEYMPQKIKVFLNFITEELARMNETHNSTFLSKTNTF